MALLGAAISSVKIASAESGSDEAQLIRSLKGRVERKGPVLTIRAKGSTAVLTDISCDPIPVPPGCVHHELVAYEPDHHMFVVENGYYEGSDYTWISDETGSVERIKGFPHYSPGGDRFVIVNAAEAFSFNGIQVWRVLNGLPELELEYSPAEYALYQFVAWQDDKSIQLRVTTYVDHELKQGLPARLVKREPGWHLEGPPERSR
jgi:hypothetical protein